DMIPMGIVEEAYRLAEELGTLVHMHVAQGGREALQIRARYSSTTVRVLEDHGLLGPRLLAAHCHYASDDELALMARRGVSMASCQSSIALIDGVAPPLARYLELGGRAALGTDQAAGNNNQSILAEMKTAALLGKTRHRDPTILPAWVLLRLVTRGAAEILGLERYVGSVERGRRADLVVFDLRAPTLAPALEKPLRNISFNIVYAARGSEIRYVFVDGRPVVEEGEITIMDGEHVVEEAQKAAEDLAEKGGEAYLAAESYLVEKWREGLF
ncbi:MAG: amidohydrolase family protein, partial [Candidatus Korarchaeota archaeon]|nr:amidohydrolase family protein [Candidatus Korarchaeota archaeon]